MGVRILSSPRGEVTDGFWGRTCTVISVIQQYIITDVELVLNRCESVSVTYYAIYQVHCSAGLAYVNSSIAKINILIINEESPVWWHLRCLSFQKIVYKITAGVVYMGLTTVPIEQSRCLSERVSHRRNAIPCQIINGANRSSSTRGELWNSQFWYGFVYMYPLFGQSLCMGDMSP